MPVALDSIQRYPILDVCGSNVQVYFAVMSSAKTFHNFQRGFRIILRSS